MTLCGKIALMKNLGICISIILFFQILRLKYIFVQPIFAILYAIIGLIISLLAYAIVNFVLKSVIGTDYIPQA